MSRYVTNADFSTKKPRCPFGGKVCFDKKTGMTKLNWLKGKGNKDYYRLYQCKCDWWHLTSKEKL